MRAPAGSPSPIFVLSHPRTGSTLLRYLIDSHPDVCCPPELALGRLCHAMAYTIGLTTAAGRSGGADSEAAVHAEVRAHLDAIMAPYCAAKQKTRWCDKSTNNVEHVAIVDAVFPDAQYLCLHRQCLDVVVSMLELCRFGFPGRYGQLVARSPDNVVDALVDGWNEATNVLLEFEAARQSRCFRVRYEDLVAAPAAVAERMLSFLELPFDAEILDRMFSIGHDPGPGDLKIQFTSSILRGRIGRGATIPRSHLSEDRLAVMNLLHEALGYEPVGRTGGGSLEYRLAVGARAAQRKPRRQWG